MLHMYVPKFYQIVQHLLAAPNDDIWVYVMSDERTGFLVFSSNGDLKRYFTVKTDLDMTRVKLHMVNETIYILSTGRKSAKVFAAHIPTE